MTQLDPPVREIRIGKTFLLTIVTIGIYYAITLYRNTKDLHEGRDGGHEWWQLWFWLGFVTLFVTWAVLYIFNAIQANKLRQEIGLHDSANGWVALGLHFAGYLTGLLALVAPFIWAAYSNELAKASPLDPIG